MDPVQEYCKQIQRRTFLARSGVGLGSVALSSLLGRSASAAKDDAGAYGGLPGLPHHAPKVKRVIFLCMAGGPSHLETFDYKPMLEKLDGKAMPTSYTEGQPIAQLQGKELKCLRPLTKFKK